MRASLEAIWSECGSVGYTPAWRGSRRGAGEVLERFKAPCFVVRSMDWRLSGVGVERVG